MSDTISKFMTAFDYNMRGHLSTNYVIDSMINFSKFDFNLFSDELLQAIHNVKYPWVEKAIENKFVQKTNSFDQIDRLDIDDIIIFIDSYRWKDIVRGDAWLTIGQKEELKESLKNCNIASYDSINDVIDEQDFSWLPFEVKHALIANFSNLNYTKEDIIYYLKTIIWDYLFPNFFDKERLSFIESEVRDILLNNRENQGWYELNSFIPIIKSNYPDIDMFEISKVCTSSQYQYKPHFRNPYTLGFKRIEPLPS